MENYANTPPRFGGKLLCSFNTLLQPLRRNRFLIYRCLMALHKNKQHVNSLHSHIYINLDHTSSTPVRNNRINSAI